MTSNDIFFSIIIPTYNPRNFLPRLLDSITRNKCIDLIEIIISDDLSKEKFDDILEKYPMLSFVKIKNDKHYGFPRNGRQNGAKVANGKWIVFSDQDDYFVDNAFDKLYDFIISTNATNYIMANFIEENAKTGEKILHDKQTGWTHGKVYEKEFWTKYNIGYDDLQYCEDINLTNIIDCVILANNIKVYEFDFPIYVWCRRKDSLADMDYFRKSMSDYIKATTGVMLKYVVRYINNPNLIAQYNLRFIVTLFHIYFYYQSNQLKNDKKGLLKAMATLQPMYSKFKEVTGFTTETIIDLVNTDLMPIYNQTREGDCKQIPFIEQIAFADFMKLYLD